MRTNGKRSQAYYSSLFYPAGASDPNQIKPQDFVEGRRSNYFVLRSSAENFYPPQDVQKGSESILAHDPEISHKGGYAYSNKIS